MRVGLDEGRGVEGHASTGCLWIGPAIMVGRGSGQVGPCAGPGCGSNPPPTGSDASSVESVIKPDRPSSKPTRT